MLSNICRGMFVLPTLLVGYILLVGSIFVGWIGLILMVIALAVVFGRRSKPPFTTLGSAPFATRDELRRAGRLELPI